MSTFTLALLAPVAVYESVRNLSQGCVNIARERAVEKSRLRAEGSGKGSGIREGARIRSASIESRLANGGRTVWRVFEDVRGESSACKSRLGRDRLGRAWLSAAPIARDLGIELKPLGPQRLKPLRLARRGGTSLVPFPVAAR